MIGLCFAHPAALPGVRASSTSSISELGDLPSASARGRASRAGRSTRASPTAAVLVGSYGGLGHPHVLNVFRAFPGHFQNLVFLSVGVVDSGEFKGEDAVEDLPAADRGDAGALRRARAGAGRAGDVRGWRSAPTRWPRPSSLCLEVAREFPRVVFFAGKLIFQRERWYQRLLHNETALAIEQRLRWAGKTMVTMPIRVPAT